MPRPRRRVGRLPRSVALATGIQPQYPLPDTAEAGIRGAVGRSAAVADKRPAGSCFEARRLAPQPARGLDKLDHPNKPMSPGGRAGLSTMDSDPRLVAMARRIIDDNLYVTLGTADGDGNPWVTPVFFTPVDHRDMYWVSSPDSTHSRNIADRPRVRLVVFDSTVRGRPGRGGLHGRTRGTGAGRGDPGLRGRLLRPPTGLREFGVDDLTGGASLRLYRALVTEHSVLIRGGDPTRPRAGLTCGGHPLSRCLIGHVTLPH